jgi:ketosteroid isomerase-like protein
MFRAKITVAFVLIACLTAFGQTKRDNSEIKSLESAYRIAVMSNDIPFFMKHIAPSYLGTDSDGIVVDQAALMTARRHNVFKFNTYEIVKQTIHLSGETAVVSECLNLDFTKSSLPHNGSFQVSRVWQKSQGVWMVLMFQNTLRTRPCQAGE